MRMGRRGFLGLLGGALLAPRELLVWPQVVTPSNLLRANLYGPGRGLTEAMLINAYERVRAYHPGVTMIYMSARQLKAYNGYLRRLP